MTLVLFGRLGALLTYSLFDPRAHLSPFSLFLLFPLSLSTCLPRSRNIVWSDYAIQCVAFNSTPRPVRDPLGVVRLKRKQEEEGVTRDGLNGEERNGKGERSIETLSCVI